MRLVEETYSLTSHFPGNEKFGLASQVQRSSVSVPSNIAEGQAKDSTKDYLRFISMSLGSLAELETQLIISRRLNYITETHLTEI
ncbi:MAG: four helix bundle protein, partial [Sulfuricella sp.]|nr:four helix bundle protein [Sulfuricella sp.]